MLSHALEARMKDLMERLVSINHHRLDLRKQDDQVNCRVLVILTILLSVCLSVCTLFVRLFVSLFVRLFVLSIKVQQRTKVKVRLFVSLIFHCCSATQTFCVLLPLNGIQRLMILSKSIVKVLELYAYSSEHLYA